MQPLAFCRLVDLDAEHQLALADNGNRGVGCGQGGDHAYIGQPGQGLDVRGEGFQPRLVAGNEQGDALRRRNVHLAAQVAAGADQVLQHRDFGLGCDVDALRRSLRVRREHNALARASRQRRDSLPQLFGDERNDRVGEPQHRFQHPHQCAPRGALLGLAASLQLYLGQFEIPIAVFVPDEFVQSARGEVEAVAVEALAHFLFCALQPAHDPAIDDRRR